jgi:hypothetical protein
MTHVRRQVLASFHEGLRASLHGGQRVAKLVREHTQKLPDLRWRTWARSFGSFGDHR